jgi:hypothetical protein
MVEDERGDLVDLVYFHHAHAPADVAGWPAPEATDHPVFCGGDAAYWERPGAPGCGERIHEVPLTEWGQREYGECPYRAIDSDECSMIRERSVAGVSNDIPACAVHGAYEGGQ